MRDGDWNPWVPLIWIFAVALWVLLLLDEVSR